MKSLLSSDLAAQAPSSTMIMKKSFSLLRAIGLSAGLVASAAMMAPAQANSSGTITASGTVPSTCSVTGADISMQPNESKSALQGTSDWVNFSTNGNYTTFTVSQPTVVSQPDSASLTSADVILTVNYNNVDYLNSNRPLVIYNPLNSRFQFEVIVGNRDSSTPLPGGSYSISSTLTCF